MTLTSILHHLLPSSHPHARVLPVNASCSAAIKHTPHVPWAAMDLDSARYSIDIQSPNTPTSKFEQEEAELLPGNLFSDSEDSKPVNARENPDRGVRCLNLLLAVLGLFFGLLAVAGWVLYWRALSGTRLMGEINGLVLEFWHPELRSPGLGPTDMPKFQLCRCFSRRIRCRRRTTRQSSPPMLRMSIGCPLCQVRGSTISQLLHARGKG